MENWPKLRRAWGTQVPGAGDGTWERLEDHWVVVPLGSHSLWYDKKNRKIRHRFVPLAFSIMEAEKGERLQLAYESIKVTVKALHDD
eukprot:scaffold673981_cov69-Prasinocladus_malaysianus.AAC.1